MPTSEDHVGHTLRAWIDGLGLTVREVAAAAGKDPSTVSRQLSAAREPSFRVLQGLAEALTGLTQAMGYDAVVTVGMLREGLTPADVLGVRHVAPGIAGRADDATRRAERIHAGLQQEADASTHVDIRDYGTLPCGDPVLPDESSFTLTPIRRSWLQRGMTAANTIVFQAVGTSMVAAGIYPGDLLLVRTDVGVSATNVAVVNTPDGCTVKRVTRTPLGYRVSAETGDPQRDALELDLVEERAVVGVVMARIGPEDVGG